MEQLIKKVEDLRMHIRSRNIMTSILSLLFLVSSLFGIFNSDNFLGARYFNLYVIFLVLFIDYYVYRNRTNLPFPKEITKDSMEDYQKTQLKRYLQSCHSMLWWAFMPMSMALIGNITVEAVFGAVSIFKIIGISTFLVIMYFSNKYWTKKYTKQYIELTGKNVEVWFAI